MSLGNHFRKVSELLVPVPGLELELEPELEPGLELEPEPGLGLVGHRLPTVILEVPELNSKILVSSFSLLTMFHTFLRADFLSSHFTTSSLKILDSLSILSRDYNWYIL